MAVKTATQVSAKWLTNYQGSTQAMTDGANNVQQPPGQLAAAQKTYWLQRITASADKWAARVGAVSLPEWKQAYIGLGIQRGQAGAAAKQGNYTSYITEELAFLGSAVPGIKAMPKGNIQQSIARSAAMIQALATWGASRT